MSTMAIRAVLEDYRDRMSDSLDTELSRAQRQTDEHNLSLATEGLSKLDAIRFACREVVREGALEDWNTAQPSALRMAIKLLQEIAEEAP